LSVSDRHAVQALAEFVPAGRPASTHRVKSSLCNRGHAAARDRGQPPRTVKAGEAFFVPAGVVHDGKNIGSGPPRFSLPTSSRRQAGRLTAK